MTVALYVRQSLDRDGLGLAVARQEQECRELAAANGWEVAEVYSDNDTSASSSRPRPEWTRLLADLRDGRHDVVLCWSTDRLYRRLRDLVDLVELAERQAVRIVAVRSGDLDLSTPAGRMLAGMLGSAARYEVEQKGARQVTANRQRAERGEVGWTRRPFGYRSTGNKADRVVSIDVGEAAELVTAAASVLDGATLSSIVADLNRRSVPTSTGGRWSVTTLRRILLNPRHRGRSVSLGVDYGPAGAPAIFDDTTADRLEAVLRDPRRRTAPSTVAKHLLSGLAVCGRCGGTMYGSPAGSPTGGRWMIYRCHTTHLARRMDLVDEVVVGVILARLSLPDAASLFVPDVDLTALREEVVDLRDRRDGLASLLADGLLAPDAVRTQAQRLTQQIGELERSIDAAASTGPVAGLIAARDVPAAWSALSLTRRREVVRSLLTVTILPAGRGARFDPETVRFDWR